MRSEVLSDISLGPRLRLWRGNSSHGGVIFRSRLALQHDMHSWRYRYTTAPCCRRGTCILWRTDVTAASIPVRMRDAMHAGCNLPQGYLQPTTSMRVRGCRCRIGHIQLLYGLARSRRRQSFIMAAICGSPSVFFADRRRSRLVQGRGSGGLEATVGFEVARSRS
jgi:hypothetical protein